MFIYSSNCWICWLLPGIAYVIAIVSVTSSSSHDPILSTKQTSFTILSQPSSILQVRFKSMSSSSVDRLKGSAHPCMHYVRTYQLVHLYIFMCLVSNEVSYALKFNIKGNNSLGLEILLQPKLSSHHEPLTSLFQTNRDRNRLCLLQQVGLTAKSFRKKSKCIDTSF